MDTARNFPSRGILILVSATNLVVQKDDSIRRNLNKKMLAHGEKDPVLANFAQITMLSSFECRLSKLYIRGCTVLKLRESNCLLRAQSEKNKLSAWSSPNSRLHSIMHLRIFLLIALALIESAVSFPLQRLHNPRVPVKRAILIQCSITPQVSPDLLQELLNESCNILDIANSCGSECVSVWCHGGAGASYLN